MRRLVPLLLFAVLALTACGASEDSSSSSGSTTTSGKAESGAFPVTIEHKYGSTTVKGEPKRVVVAGLREQDALLGLGIVPVATTEWFGKHPGAIFPWATKALGGAKVPTVLSSTDGLQIEKIAAQRPDLIIGIYSGMTKKEYTALSRIAPVIAQKKGLIDYGTSWQDETIMTGEAVGQPAKARKLVADSEGLIADAAADHPEFKGQTVGMVTDYQGIFVYAEDDVRVRLLLDLGFTWPEDLGKALPGKFGGNLSDEKTELLDTGVLVWFADGDNSVAKLERRAVYRDLNVRKEGRDVFISADDRLYEVMSFPSVLAMPTLLKELVPRLAAAADGDPSSSTDQT